MPDRGNPTTMTGGSSMQLVPVARLLRPAGEVPAARRPEFCAAVAAVMAC